MHHCNDVEKVIFWLQQWKKNEEQRQQHGDKKIWILRSHVRTYSINILLLFGISIVVHRQQHDVRKNQILRSSVDKYSITCVQDSFYMRNQYWMYALKELVLNLHNRNFDSNSDD